MKVMMNVNLQTAFYGELKKGFVYDLYDEDAIKYINEGHAIARDKDTAPIAERNVLLEDALLEMSKYNKRQVRVKISLNVGKVDRKEEKEEIKNQIVKRFEEQFKEFKKQIKLRKIKEEQAV